MLVTKASLRFLGRRKWWGVLNVLFTARTSLPYLCATKSQTSQIMARAVDDVELIIVPLSLMEKWMTEHRSWYEFVILRTEFDLKNYWKLSTISRLEQWMSA
jgi:CRP/FNR family transcriptional regulator